MSLLRKLSPLLLLLVLVESGYILYPRVSRRIRKPEVSKALRGKHVAMRAGCFGCHGDGGHGRVANPGSATGVPGFREGVLLMYAESASELREWISDGAPRRLQEDADYRAAREKLGLRMPAFKDKLDAEEIDQLVSYIMAVSQTYAPAPDTPEAKGLEIAEKNACFGCHGDLGLGGNGNLASFKGYIPGFWGADYDELVRDDAELREWIETGSSRRLAANPIARRYLSSQIVSMPAYKDRLGPAEIDALVAAVKWIHAAGWTKSGATP
ncbi:MAG: c-type cytochrome [bacterium]